MAALAICRSEGWSGGRVHRVGGFLPVRQMARIALRRKAEKHPRRRLFMAGIALHRRMRAKQRKPILVVANLLRRNHPAVNRVTLRAVRTHLPPVHIAVTIRAILSYVGENRFGVAFDARHFLVHSTQGVFRFVVIEFRNGANRLPTRSCVAILARHL